MANAATHIAIDIGTNSILLLVARKSDGSNPSLTPIIDQAQTVRLGESLHTTGYLSDQAIERTLTGLQSYLKIAKSFSPLTILCFGTEALRRASNSDVFCRRVRQELNLELRILSPIEEAYYTFQGAVSSLSPSIQQTNILVIDIGGGSTEIVYGTNNAIEYQQSFPIGAVYTKEKFQLTEKISTAEALDLQRYVRTSVVPLPKISQDTTIILTGGTATTLATLDQQLKNYDFRAIDGYRMAHKRVTALYTQLNQLSLEERVRLPGMEAGREDIILPALNILLTILEQLAISTVQISVRGTRYGLLL